MRIRNQRDFWSGVLFIVTGLLFAALSYQYQMGTAAKMGAGWFPRALGVIMAVLGLMLAAPALSSKAPETHVGRMDFKSVFFILLAVAVYAATLPKLGFIVAVVLLIFISSYASHEFSFKTTAVSTVALLIFSWLVFVKGLELQFPFLPTFLTR